MSRKQRRRLCLEPLEQRQLLALVVGTDPDDQIAEATSLAVDSSRTNLAVDVSGDVDMFSFSVAAGQRLHIDVDSNWDWNGYFDSVLRLFDVAGNPLAMNDDGAAPGEQALPESFLDFTFEAAGTYVIGISGHGNAAYDPVTGDGDVPSSVGRYSITLTAVQGNDPNDQMEEASLLEFGVTQPGIIVHGAQGDDVDMCRFNAVAGQRVGIDVDIPIDSTLDSYIRVFNAAGSEIAYNDDGIGPGEFFTKESYVFVTIPMDGTYFVGISGSANRYYDPVTGTGDLDSSTGDYTVTITSIEADDPDDQISEAHPIAVGDTATDAISFDTDVDMYALNVAAGQRLQFDVDTSWNWNGTLDSMMRLFNAAGVELASNDDGAAPGESVGVESYLEYTFSSAGTYYVGISGYSNAGYNAVSGIADAPGSMGSYTLTISAAAPGDPDDQINEAWAINIGDSVNDSISPAIVGDVDMYKVSVLADQRLGIDIDNLFGSTLDSFVRVFDAAGHVLAYNDDAMGPSPELSILESYLAFTFPAAGTYYIGVSGQGNIAYDPMNGTGDTDSTTGGYTMTVTDLGHGEGTSNFQIELVTSGFSDTEKAILNQAAARWCEVITGDLPDVVYQGRPIDDLVIDISAIAIDGEGNILGRATPTVFRPGGLPCRGMVEIDSADLADLESRNILFDTVLHEMGHVLGIGVMWDQMGLLGGTSADPRFLGPQANAAYAGMVGKKATKVPVEAGGGAGTALSHWRESTFVTELMTGWTQDAPPMPLSAITVGSLGDLGYQVNLAAADYYLPPGTIPTQDLVRVDSFTAVPTSASVGDRISLSATASALIGVTKLHFYHDANGNRKADASELIATDADGTDGWSASWSTAGELPGNQVLLAVAEDVSGNLSRPAILAVSLNAASQNPAPKVESFTIDPASPIVIGRTVSLTATVSDDADAVRRCVFYVDRNANGLGDPDEIIGVDFTGIQEWSIAWDTKGMAAGTFFLLVVAEDSGFARSSPMAIEVTFVATTDDLQPVVSSLSARPVGPVIAGQTVGLNAIASDSNLGDAVQKVSFYLDLNRDGVADAGELLGSDVDGSDGWTCDWQTTRYATPSVQILAVAFDADNTPSTPKALEVTVGSASLAADVIAGFGSGIGLWSWDQTGTWSPLNGYTPLWVLSGDVDNNGKADMVANFGGNVGLWIHHDTGAWQWIRQLPSSTAAMADLNGDGCDELVVSTSLAGAAGVWAYYPVSATWRCLTGRQAESFAIGDFDGNGKADVAADFGANGLWFFKNDSTWECKHGYNPIWMAAGDQDGNGKSELFVSFAQSADVWTLQSTGAWTWLNRITTINGLAADIDGDGKSELAVTIDSGGLSGLWTFDSGANLWRCLTTWKPESLASADVDGNGKQDLVGDFGANGLFLFKNDAEWQCMHSLDATVLGSIQTGQQAPKPPLSASARSGLLLAVLDEMWASDQTAIKRRLALR